jgi:hypothetical protein
MCAGARLLALIVVATIDGGCRTHIDAGCGRATPRLFYCGPVVGGPRLWVPHTRARSVPAGLK